MATGLMRMPWPILRDESVTEPLDILAGLRISAGAACTAAVSLYHTPAYEDISNYGQYAGVENSVCMKKCFRN